MQPSFLNLPSGAVAFRKFGSGQRLLIAFHGFSENGAAFAELGKRLEDCCTLYAIDLPFHGNTRWEGRDYRPAELVAIVGAILEREGSGRFEAIGHSMGARLWLHLLPGFRDRMEALYLLAPDGLQTRWLYLAEWPSPGLRSWLARFARRPGSILRLARPLHQARLIGPFLFRYLAHHLSETERRRRLLHTWFSLAHFRLSRKKVLRLLRQARFPVLVLTGRNDQLVKPEAIRQYLKGAENVRIQVVEATHRSICRAAVSFLQEGLKK